MSDDVTASSAFLLDLVVGPKLCDSSDIVEDLRGPRRDFNEADTEGVSEVPVSAEAFSEELRVDEGRSVVSNILCMPSEALDTGMSSVRISRLGPDSSRLETDTSCRDSVRIETGTSGIEADVFKVSGVGST